MDRQAFALGDKISLRHLQNITAMNRELTALRERVKVLEADNARLRQHIADTANRINVAGSHYHQAQQALDAIVTEVKQSARKALQEPK